MELSTFLADTDALAELDAAHTAAWNAVDAELLSLCRDRVAVLLGHDSRPGPHTSNPVDDRAHAAVAFTEQFVVDVTGITDEQVEALRAHLGDQGLVDFVNALIVLEQRMTLELGLTAVLGDEVPT